MTERKNEIFTGQQEDRAPQMPGGGIFEVPIIDVPLPSDGKVYPAGSPLAGARSITITSMTAAQENILTNKSLAKRGTVLTDLIQSCLADRSINAKNLLIGDRNTIMVSLRISGYGPDYKVKVTCPSCDDTSVQTFDLLKLPIRRLQIDPIEQGANVFEIALPQSKAKVRFKFLTGADEEEIALTQTRKKQAGLLVDSELVTSGLLQTIISIAGVTDRSQISMALPRMPALDSKTLRNYIKDNEPGMQLKGEMICKQCEFVGEVDMPLGAGFFWPGSE